MNLEGLLSKPPRLHGRDGATTDGWRLDDAAFLFLDSRVKSGMRTIETGAGVRTIAFALKRSRHTCIVRDRRVVGEFVGTAHLPVSRWAPSGSSLTGPSMHCPDSTGSATTSR